MTTTDANDIVTCYSCLGSIDCRTAKLVRINMFESDWMCCKCSASAPVVILMDSDDFDF